MTARTKLILALAVIVVPSFVLIHYSIANSLVIEKLGSTYTYRSDFNFMWFIVPLILVLIISGAYLSLQFRFGWLPMLAVLGIGILITYFVFSIDISNHKVIVDLNSVYSEWGTVDAPESVRIDFSSLTELSLVRRDTNGVQEDLLIAKNKSGETITMPVNDLVRAALNRLLANASAHEMRLNIYENERPD